MTENINDYMNILFDYDEGRLPNAFLRNNQYF